MGKGVIIQPTLWGNLLLGPTARDMHIPEHANQPTEHITAYLLSKCQALIPFFEASDVIHSFAGARAKTDRGDWIIEESAKAPGFIQAAGVDSPGLASVRLLQLTAWTRTHSACAHIRMHDYCCLYLFFFFSLPSLHASFAFLLRVIKRSVVALSCWLTCCTCVGISHTLRGCFAVQSPAIAVDVVRMLQKAGLKTPPNPTFNPNRRPIVTPKDGWKGIKLDHEDPTKNVRATQRRSCYSCCRLYSAFARAAIHHCPSPFSPPVSFAALAGHLQM